MTILPPPTFEIIGGEPSDAAIAALARILLASVDDEIEAAAAVRAELATVGNSDQPATTIGKGGS